MLLGTAASSASVLMLEVVLTRVFAVTQFYHFAFLTVSLALLGFGASGSVLTVVPVLGRGGPRRWSLLAGLQAVAAIGAYLVTNLLPFDSYAIAWERIQLLYLVAYYLALAVPFFLGGLVIGVLLAGAWQPDPVPSHQVYAASLAGSGIGCLLALGGLPLLGGAGTILAAAAVAGLGALAFLTGDPHRRPAATVTVAAAVAVLLAVGVVSPAFLDLRLSPYKALSAALRYPGAEVLATDWGLGARTDHVRSDGIRSLAGLSYAVPELPPPQDAVAFDGDDLSPIPLVPADQAAFAGHLLGALPYRLRPGSEALVLRPRGGLEVLTAIANGSSSVTAVEPSHGAIAAARRSGFSAYADPRVDLVEEEPRVFVERTGRRFDVIALALTASYRPVFSGAYSLAEDYGLTVEAFTGYLNRLEPDGILTAMRWLQNPPSEAARLIALAGEAARRAGADPTESVVVLRSYAVALVMVSPGGFTSDDLDRIRAFAEEKRFDLVAAPQVTPVEANRFSVVPDDPYHPLATALLSVSDPGDVYSAAGFDIRPPTDDHPFFGHFFTWSQASTVLDTLGTTWQPFGGAGYLVLVALLILSAAGAAGLILLPLVVGGRSRRPRPGSRAWTFAYFGLLGLGFLFVEIPLIQRYILLVGHPTSALAVVLFALLLASGAGSLASRRIRWRPAGMAVTVAILLTLLLVRLCAGLLLQAPLWVRMPAGALLLAPLGFLMGVLFPKGVAHLEEAAPHLVPWAWAVNGTASVISAVGSALLALTFGFRFVILSGALCYALATLLTRPAKVTRSG